MRFTVGGLTPYRFRNNRPVTIVQRNGWLYEGRRAKPRSRVILSENIWRTFPRKCISRKKKDCVNKISLFHISAKCYLPIFDYVEELRHLFPYHGLVILQTFSKSRRKSEQCPRERNEIQRLTAHPAEVKVLRDEGRKDGDERELCSFPLLFLSFSFSLSRFLI